VKSPRSQVHRKRLNQSPATQIVFDQEFLCDGDALSFDRCEATCHWPIGDPSSPDFFFCGGKVLTGLPYCPQHSRVAYQPPANLRRQTIKRPGR
jgi:hypothetical protein